MPDGESKGIVRDEHEQYIQIYVSYLKIAMASRDIKWTPTKQR